MKSLSEYSNKELEDMASYWDDMASMCPEHTGGYFTAKQFAEAIRGVMFKRRPENKGKKD